ncbi:hypothetical protein PV325_006529 [Microctonus aethiopoides]|nr:hypothetical protein PV325_006529 [Microctonus aethiopoides]
MASITILDGGFSTQLATHVGVKIDGDPLWTARFLETHPKSVLDTHLDFLRAGAFIIETNSYQASIEGFIEHLGITESESLQLIHKSVELAKEAVNVYLEEIKDNNDVSNNKPLIAGSCGPYGASLHDGSEYTGEYASTVSKEFLKKWHKPRIEALINSGVDLLALETIPCKIEAEALVELLKEYPNIEAWLTFSCRTDGKCIVDGSDFQKIALECYENAIPGQLIAVGVNCIAPTAVSSLFQGINSDREKELVPLIVYPNSGEIYTVAEGWKKCGKVPPLENFIHEWLDLGVRYVGGCCRTQASDITKISIEALKWEKKNFEKIFSENSD